MDASGVEKVVYNDPEELAGKTILRVEVCEGCGARCVVIEGQNTRIVLPSSWVVPEKTWVDEIASFYCVVCRGEAPVCD